MSRQIRKTSNELLLTSERIGLGIAQRNLRIYSSSISALERSIGKLLGEYEVDGGIAPSILRSTLSNNEQRELETYLLSRVSGFGLKPDMERIRGHVAQLTRLDAIREQAYIEAMRIAPSSADLVESGLSTIARNTYNSKAQVIADVGNITGTFTRLDTQGVKVVLSTQWEGGNFSTRIWKNTDKLSSQLSEILGEQIITGQPLDTTVRNIRERYDVSRYEAMRLVRTETNYIHNQADLAVKKDFGITRYQFDAVMDGKTSDECNKLHGQVFLVKDAVVGINYPCMHPNCRSTTFDLLDGEEEYIRERPVLQEKIYDSQQMREDFQNGSDIEPINRLSEQLSLFT